MGHTVALSTVLTGVTSKQSVRGPLGHCLLYIQWTLATSQGEGRPGTEDTDKQTDRGHPQWDTQGHCQLYIQRA